MTILWWLFVIPLVAVALVLVWWISMVVIFAVFSTNPRDPDEELKVKDQKDEKRDE